MTVEAIAPYDAPYYRAMNPDRQLPAYLRAAIRTEESTLPPSPTQPGERLGAPLLNDTDQRTQGITSTENANTERTRPADDASDRRYEHTPQAVATTMQNPGVLWQDPVPGMLLSAYG